MLSLLRQELSKRKGSKEVSSTVAETVMPPSSSSSIAALPSVLESSLVVQEEGLSNSALSSSSLVQERLSGASPSSSSLVLEESSIASVSILRRPAVASSSTASQMVAGEALSTVPPYVSTEPFIGTLVSSLFLPDFRGDRAAYSIGFVPSVFYIPCIFGESRTPVTASICSIGVRDTFNGFDNTTSSGSSNKTSGDSNSSTSNSKAGGCFGSCYHTATPPSSTACVVGSRALLACVDAPAYDARWIALKTRRLQRWGGQVTPEGLTHEEPLPGYLSALSEALVAAGIFPSSHPPNHVLINDYAVDEGILPHTDGPSYYPLVATISLGSDAIMHYMLPRDEECRGAQALQKAAVGGSAAVSGALTRSSINVPEVEALSAGISSLVSTEGSLASSLSSSFLVDDRMARVQSGGPWGAFPASTCGWQPAVPVSSERLSGDLLESSGGEVFENTESTSGGDGGSARFVPESSSSSSSFGRGSTASVAPGLVTIEELVLQDGSMVVFQDTAYSPCLHSLAANQMIEVVGEAGPCVNSHATGYTEGALLSRGRRRVSLTIRHVPLAVAGVG